MKPTVCFVFNHAGVFLTKITGEDLGKGMGSDGRDGEVRDGARGD